MNLEQNLKSRISSSFPDSSLCKLRPRAEVTWTDTAIPRKRALQPANGCNPLGMQFII